MEDALRAAQDLATRHIRSVLTQLGENVTSPAEAAGVAHHYRHLLEQIAERRLPSQVSAKPTHLGLDLGDEICLRHLDALAARAESLGNFIWIDMEGSAYVDRTLELFRHLRADHENVGVCVQAYLHRTPHDLEALHPLAPSLRLVKGAYQEPPATALARKRDVDARYVELATRLLTQPAFHHDHAPAFGTHDMAIVRAIQRVAAAQGVAKDAFEFQMLYGIRRDDQVALAQAGYTMRVLISYGNAWFPWYMRRLAERPANLWFVVKSMFV